jgi:hypothetical protein
MEKPIYETPQLVCYGTVADLTRDFTIDRAGPLPFPLTGTDPVVS